jgi:3-oxoacyl-[acyl-carrier protein] reductase
VSVYTSALAGKVALVTGGGVGIGRAIAKGLAESGADVAITWRTHGEGAKTVLKEISADGRRTLGMELDATSSKDVDDKIKEVANHFGRLDILINNVGGLVARVPIAEMSDEHWHHVVNLNLSSSFYCCRASSRLLAEAGRVVNVASLAGFSGGGAGGAAYAAAKAGLFGLTRGLARELAPRSITVNAVAPGLILETPFHELHTSLKQQEAVVSSLPVKRPGLPADVASAVVWLCSPGAGFVTGEIVNINGGQAFQ